MLGALSGSGVQRAKSSPMPPESADTTKTVSIRPGVSVLSVLRHLNYKPWFALAEFVDNAVQSYADNSERLLSHHGKNWK